MRSDDACFQGYHADGNPHCPRCRSTSTCKNGTANGDPKRKCKDCDYQFTCPFVLGFIQEQRDRAVVLYLEGLSLRAVARLLSTTATSVLKGCVGASGWEGTRAKADPEPGAVPVIEVDEMWHCVKKIP